MVRVKTIDAHAAGEPLRLIVDGFPAPRGKTMLEKRDWVKRHADHLRRALMLEPRGHADMYGAILTEPVSPGSHAGVLFMHNEGYSTMCGHGVVAVTTIALERGLLMSGDGTTVVYDAPAGTIRARARLGAERAGGAGPEPGAAGGPGGPGRASRVESVAFVNVPSFVLHGGLTVKLASRQIRADVAFGGAFYAIVDSEAVGLPIDVPHLPELRRVGMEIKHAIEAARTIVHPLEPGLKGIYGTIFTGPPEDERADLRNVTIFADAENRTVEIVAESEDFYRSRAAPVRVEACPLADASLIGHFGKRGYRVTEFSNVMVRPLDGAYRRQNQSGLPPGLSIEHVGREQIDLWALTVSQGFAEKGPVVPEIVEVMKMFALSPGVESYLARVDGKVAGGATLAIRDGVAGLFGASTLPAFRRRGVHMALLQARLARAAEAGCDLAVCLAQPGSTSQRNIVRRGFTVLYTRVKFERELELGNIAK